MEAASDQPASSGPEEGPLVAVHFQKNPELVRKYLEAEPKALGISEILFSTFVISTSIISLRYNFDEHEQNITHIISSLFIVIAGAVAIAAKNLHLPTVKACLGLQVLACLASVVNFMVTFSKFASPPTSYFCWMSHYGGGPENVFCSKLISTFDHYNAAAFVVHVTLIAISGTLAAYCCKVIDCCCPKSKMPVITVNAPPAEQ